jgi:RimJ/RimL family protein N-acetyltransferase
MAEENCETKVGDPLPLQTPRLTLRRFRAEDAALFLEYRNNAAVARYQSWTGCTGPEAKAFVESMAGAVWGTPGAWFQIALEERLTGALAGDCACHFLKNESAGVELGFTISPAYQRRGYASEAVAALLDFLLRRAGYRRVTASTDPRNLPSVRLLRKLGFALEAHEKQSLLLKGEWCDDLRFALSREAWQARG